MALRKLVAGNWKMHGLSSDLVEIKAIADAARDYPAVDVALCVPAILIDRAARAVPQFAIGAQDVHYADIAAADKSAGLLEQGAIELLARRLLGGFSALAQNGFGLRAQARRLFAIVGHPGGGSCCEVLPEQSCREALLRQT